MQYKLFLKLIYMQISSLELISAWAWVLLGRNNNLLLLHARFLCILSLQYNSTPICNAVQAIDDSQLHDYLCDVLLRMSWLCNVHSHKYKSILFGNHDNSKNLSRDTGYLWIWRHMKERCSTLNRVWMDTAYLTLTLMRLTWYNTLPLTW